MALKDGDQDPFRARSSWDPVMSPMTRLHLGAHRLQKWDRKAKPVCYEVGKYKANLSVMARRRGLSVQGESRRKKRSTA